MYKERYAQWKKQVDLPGWLQEELVSMEEDEESVRDAFFDDLHFGTSGLRGVMGAGCRRINELTIARASKGLADYMNRSFSSPVLVINYDNRHRSKEFAQITSRVMSENGIKVYFFAEMMPVSALSYVIPALSATMGVMITASHNPKEYNGYKVYGSHGGQILYEQAEEIAKHIEQTDIFYFLKNKSLRGPWSEKAQPLSSDLEERYIRGALDVLDNKKDLSVKEERKKLKIVYTPLYGTGRRPVEQALSRAGFSSLWMVKEQSREDGDFPTCVSPNPENPQAYRLALELAKEIHADLVIATDPDCDRVGVFLREKKESVFLTGNEIAVLLFDYICRFKRLPSKPVAIRTIVSTPLFDAIAEQYHVQVEHTLIGFKYVGKKMEQLVGRYVFAFEEGNGFLAKDDLRDKDGVSTVLLFCQMAAYYRSRGMELSQRLEELGTVYGYYREKVLSYTYPGEKGFRKIMEIMEYLRNNEEEGLFPKKIEKIIDYKKGYQGFPRENILEYRFCSGEKIIIRPSGTEPKVKVYLFAHSKNKARAKNTIEELETMVGQLWQRHSWS